MTFPRFFKPSKGEPQNPDRLGANLLDPIRDFNLLFAVKSVDRELLLQSTYDVSAKMFGSICIYLKRQRYLLHSLNLSTFQQINLKRGLSFISEIFVLC